ncbi:acyl-CoA dehydrogenase family protein [Thermodesulfobacteriota bacterium]
MDYQFSKEQQDIKNAAREFAEKEFPEIAGDVDIKEEFPVDVWKKACSLGLVGCFIPEEYGGAGYGVMELCCIAEEFFRVDPGCGMCMVSVAVGSEVLLLFGDERQKETYLPPIVKGEKITGIAITEPDAGSDTLSASTSAKRMGDHYLINGTKMFITNGDIADFLIIYCKTNPEAPKPSNQFSMIIVETDRPGYESSKLTGKLGIRASNTSEVQLVDVQVPCENLVGTEGEGFPYLMGFFNRTRIMVVAQSVGLAQGAMERGIRHIKNRKQFGKPLSEFQANRFKIAEMGTMIEASRNLTYKAATEVDRGNIDPGMVAMAKWFSALTAVRAADEALQMHGGYGYMGENDISRFYATLKLWRYTRGLKKLKKK